MKIGETCNIETSFELDLYLQILKVSSMACGAEHHAISVLIQNYISTKTICSEMESLPDKLRARQQPGSGGGKPTWRGGAGWGGVE